VLPPVLPVPRWIGPVFTTLALVTIPWTVYLAATLPEHSETRNYRAAWVGFDLGLVALLVVTAHLAYRGNRHVAVTATATATALVVDAWFDVITAPHTADLVIAGLTALLGELPLAGLCLWITLHVDRVVARRLRQLARRADREATRGTGSDARDGWLGVRDGGLGARDGGLGVRDGGDGGLSVRDGGHDVRRIVRWRLREPEAGADEALPDRRT
jgi:hypothetical protein